MQSGTKEIIRQVKDYLLVTLGSALYVLGWTIFLAPNNLVGGGVTGISSIIQYASGIPMGYTYLVINIGLLLVAFAILGRSFGGKTIFAILLVAMGLNLLQKVIPPNFIDMMAIQNGKLMCTIMGGIMAGLGVGLSISVGGSTGGTDIIALIINKYWGVSPGRTILVSDVIILLASLLVPSFTADGSLMPFAEKFTTVIYGLILVTISSNVADIYIAGSKQSVQVFILSKKHEEIAKAITHNLKRGVTELYGRGWYTKQDTVVLMVMTRKHDLNLLLRYVKTIDRSAFLSVASVSGVYGEGFDEIKTRLKKPEEDEDVG